MAHRKHIQPDPPPPIEGPPTIGGDFYSHLLTRQHRATDNVNNQRLSAYLYLRQQNQGEGLSVWNGQVQGAVDNQTVRAMVRKFLTAKRLDQQLTAGATQEAKKDWRFFFNQEAVTKGYIEAARRHYPLSEARERAVQIVQKKIKGLAQSEETGSWPALREKIIHNISEQIKHTPDQVFKDMLKVEIEKGFTVLKSAFLGLTTHMDPQIITPEALKKLRENLQKSLPHLEAALRTMDAEHLFRLKKDSIMEALKSGNYKFEEKDFLDPAAYKQALAKQEAAVLHQGRSAYDRYVATIEGTVVRRLQAEAPVLIKQRYERAQQAETQHTWGDTFFGANPRQERRPYRSAMDHGNPKASTRHGDPHERRQRKEGPPKPRDFNFFGGN